MPLSFHRGIGFRLVLAEYPETWRWAFFLGGEPRSGVIRTREQMSAERRVRSRIDRDIERAIRRGITLESTKRSADELLELIRKRLSGRHLEVAIKIGEYGKAWTAVVEVDSVVTREHILSAAAYVRATNELG